MTLLSDMRKIATTMAKKKKDEEQQAKTKANTTTAKKTTNLTQDQKQQAINSINNIRSQWVIKWSITNAKQWAETKAEKTFYNKSTDKEIQAYKTMVDEWYAPAEARQAITTVRNQKNTVTYTRSKQEKIVDTRTDKQQNAYNTLISEWYSEKEAKKAVQKAIQKDWDTWKKVKTAIKSFWQWVSDVWQRTVGRVFGAWIDRVEWKLDNLYENNEWFQNFVNKAWTWLKNSLWLTDEQVQAFQQSEALRKEQWIPSTYWNILTDEEASSRIWTAWRKFWQFAWSTALSMAAWWIASGWAKAIWTSLWSKAIWWLAGTILWVWEWALTSDIYARWMSDRRATKWEAIWWAIAWWILWWISWYRQTAKALANNKKLENLVQDHSSKAKDLAAAEWRIVEKKWVLQTETVQELSQKEKDALKIIKKEWLYNPKAPWKLSTNIQKSISKTATEMSDDMKNIKVSDRWKQELKDKLKDIVKNPDDWTKANQDKITKLIKKVDDVTNADELWKLRQWYDDLFSAWQKAWYGKGWTAETMYDLWQSWRKILNDAMNDAAEKAWKETVKEWMKKLNTLINTRAVVNKNLWKQIWDVSLTRLWKVVKWAKTWTKKIVWWWLLLWWWYLWGKKWATVSWSNE